MPIVQIHLLEGRSNHKKEVLISKVTQSIVEALEVKEQSVRVILTEMPKQHFGIAGKSVREMETASFENSDTDLLN